MQQGPLFRHYRRVKILTDHLRFLELAITKRQLQVRIPCAEAPAEPSL
jgi:hypothetical protein